MNEEQKTDYRALALEQAGKLENANVKELLGRAEEIEEWLRKSQVKTDYRTMDEKIRDSGAMGLYGADLIDSKPIYDAINKLYPPTKK